MTKTVTLPIVHASQGKVFADSRDVAAYFGKRHGDVLRTIENLSCSPEFTQRNFAFSEYSDPTGRSLPKCEMTKDGFAFLVGGFTGAKAASFKERYIERFNEMETTLREQAPSAAVPASFAAALRLAAEQQDLIEQQAQALAAAAPAIQFVETYVSGKGLKGFREVAKLLKANESDFRAFLVNRKIMYRLAGTWTAHAEHLDAGRFRTVTGTANGNDHTFTQAKFTPKGVEWIAGEWARRAVKKAIAAEAAAQSPDLLSFGQASAFVN